MKPTILESPYAGDVERNVKYAQLCMADMLSRGEAPYASHLLYTQPHVLDDDVAEERIKGIEAGFVFRELCEKSVFYVDFGMSRGMKLGYEDAQKKGKSVEKRELPRDVFEKHFQYTLYDVSVMKEDLKNIMQWVGIVAAKTKIDAVKCIDESEICEELTDMITNLEYYNREDAVEDLICTGRIRVQVFKPDHGEMAGTCVDLLDY